MHFKHLRGQHDQRTHGNPGTGMGSGGYSSQLGQPSGGSSPQPRTDFLVKGKIPTELGKVDIDGLPSMKRVERGENGISRVEDAIAFVKKGGALRDVPDDFLLSAVQAATQRFSTQAVGAQGINGGLTQFTDNTNGQRYLSKYVSSSYRPNEDIAEILGNNLAGRLGFPIGTVRFAADSSSGSGFRRPILLEHVSNAVQGEISKPGRDFRPSILPYDDLVSASILDYILLNPDRHDGNYFITNQQAAQSQRGGFFWRRAEPKKDPRFVPIDPSLGFNVLGAKRRDGSRRRPGSEPVDVLSETTPQAIQEYFTYEDGLHKSLRTALSMQKPASMKNSIQEVVDSIDRAKKRLLNSEKQQPFAVAAMDALRAGGFPVRDRNMPRRGGFDPRQSLPGLEATGPLRRPRRSFWGDGTDSFITWPSNRIKTVLGIDSEELASYILDMKIK